MRALRHARILAAGVLLALATPSATAQEIEGVDFSDRLERSGTTFNLFGLGLLRYRVIFKGYVAALYLGDGVPAEDVLEDTPKRLEIEYFWKIEGRDIAAAADKILKQNLDEQSLAPLRPRIEQIGALFQDVKPGDRYALTYVPGVGTELSLNGESKGVIPGADFAEAYLSIWLGAKPIDRSLRDQLLTPL